MGSIQELLNPAPDEIHRYKMPRETTKSPEPPRKMKVSKDGPVFRPGAIQGQFRYPPCEERDEELAEHHRNWNLTPMGNISAFPRHIPYQSEKKTFHQRTGRDSFHVLQYTFQSNQDKKMGRAPWVIMWDYNIGLVRTTPLFKCMGYSKTTPGKALGVNPGLREICHSITGGALAAQGYWMPFEAAKALAATFCWKIRFVLTPLFGNDFPELCIPEDNHSRFANMVVDSDIVTRATELANYYRMLENGNITCARNDASPVDSSRFQEPEKEADYPSATEDLPYRRLTSKLPRHSYLDDVGSARGSSSDSFCGSPSSPTRSTFTPINMPRSSDVMPRSLMLSPRELLNFVSEARIRNIQRLHADESESEIGFSPGSRIEQRRMPGFLPRDGSDGAIADVDSDLVDSDTWVSDDDKSLEDDEDEEYPSMIQCSRNIVTAFDQTTPKKNPFRSAKARRCRGPLPAGGFTKEVKAAHALLHLHMQRATAQDVGTDGHLDEPFSGSPSRFHQQEDKKRRASL
ncbi:hypothetical protein N7462_008143 [Penicillium macrosclerotiorum]|uniref:uncharacterized protein n=1 Tax=Penicillium macrosclerotiorum TaxID=303699 RepID=UPI002547450C|nr:uncharacterized protein N7462_008143 [Penicillium macrosclerotiorum]KAJ5679899.1 hypothetical protein N7462_008143 [Penicillium macrosclerotiorum]